jgi:hypothetical protein
MMGSGRRGISICFTTLRAFASQAQDSQRDYLALRPHGNDPFHPVGQIAFARAFIFSCRGETGGRAGLFAETELRFVAPHAMQHDGEFTCDSDTRPCHAPSLGDLHAPGPKRRPLAAAHKQRVGCLVEGSAGKFVAATADLALDIGFARLVARRCEAEMRAHLPGAHEAGQPILGRALRLICRPKLKPDQSADETT